MNMCTARGFEIIIFFCSLTISEDGIHRKTLAVRQDYIVGTLTGSFVQRLPNVWKELFWKSLLTDISNAIAS